MVKVMVRAADEVGVLEADDLTADEVGVLAADDLAADEVGVLAADEVGVLAADEVGAWQQQEPGMVGRYGQVQYLPVYRWHRCMSLLPKHGH